jgi:hypothetical protein
MKDDETRITDMLLIEERERAIKIRKGNIEAWLPRSCITISKDPIVAGAAFRSISVTMPDWLAEEKKLD